MIKTIAEIINSLIPILMRIIPDPDKRLDVQNQIEQALINSQAKIYDSMKEVMVADSSSESGYTRAARPTIVYWSLGLISLVVILAPFGYDGAIIQSLKSVPSDLWNLMTYSVGAFVLGRSVEKSAGNFRKQ